MQYSLSEFNDLDETVIKTSFLKCCGSTQWADKLMQSIPFHNEEGLLEKTRTIWYDECGKKDYLEAFSHHPKIGGKDKLREKFALTKDWASNEQSGIDDSDEITLDFLAQNNDLYYQKYGFVFLICATGKSAKEMSDILVERLKNTEEEELRIAMGEQYKITLLRLQKLLSLHNKIWHQVSQITSHVLDTSLGLPGANICIRMKMQNKNGFSTIALGITNNDGRVADLLPAGLRLNPGHYQMCFDTGNYFTQKNTVGFYPKVDIDFTIFDDTHYHVPLLINPFGYSTYRGS